MKIRNRGFCPLYFSTWDAFAKAKTYEIRVILIRAAAKIKNRQLSASYEGWLDYVDRRLHFKSLGLQNLPST